MNNNRNVSKKLIILLVIISILVIAIDGVAFALFINKENNKSEEFFDSGSVVMTYAENSDIFFINNMLPLASDVARINSDVGQYYDFTVKVNVGDSKSVDYEIALEIDDEFTTALPQNVFVYLEKQESGTYIPVIEPTAFDKLDLKSSCNAPDTAKIIAKVSSEKTISHNYRLRMWLADGTVVSPEFLQSFGIEINVYGKAK